LTDLKVVRIREITLAVAAVWLAWHGGFAARDVRAQSEAVRQMESQIREIQSASHSSAMVVEARMTKVETQLGILASSVDRLMWGVVGSFGAFIAQSLWGVITFRKRAKGDTDGA
jgi:hypothetical protein